MAKAKRKRSPLEKEEEKNQNEKKKKKNPWWYIFFVFTFNTNAATVEEPGFSKHVEKKHKGDTKEETATIRRQPYVPETATLAETQDSKTTSREAEEPSHLNHPPQVSTLLTVVLGPYPSSWP